MVKFSKDPIFKRSNFQISNFQISNFQKIQFSKDPIFKRPNFQKATYRMCAVLMRTAFSVSCVYKSLHLLLFYSSPLINYKDSPKNINSIIKNQ